MDYVSDMSEKPLQFKKSIKACVKKTFLALAQVSGSTYSEIIFHCISNIWAKLWKKLRKLVVSLFLKILINLWVSIYFTGVFNNTKLKTTKTWI